MALSNSQYDLLMRIYEQRQLEDEQRLRRRRKEAYERIPALRRTEEEISSVSVAKAKNLLDGDETALASAKETLAGLFARKRQLLLRRRVPGRLPGTSLCLPRLPGHRLHRHREVPLLQEGHHRPALPAVQPAGDAWKRRISPPSAWNITPATTLTRLRAALPWRP